jgi:hypothetical protein
MTLPSEFTQKSTDAVDQFPFRGIATGATGALAMAMILPLMLAVSPREFINGISIQSFAIGVVLAIITDYLFGHLTDDDSHWPILPAWISEPRYGFVLAFASGIVAFSISLLPAPSWAPVVAIGGMHAFATAGVTALILGAARSAVCLIRQIA